MAKLQKGLVKNKKGLSGVVTVMIIIMLSVVLIGIMWVVASNLVESGAEQVNLERFALLNVKAAYVDGDTVKVRIRRTGPTSSDNVVGAKFLFFDGSNTVSVEKNVPIGNLEEKLFTFASSEVPTISAGDSVAAAPIYMTSGGSKFLGDIAGYEPISSVVPGSSGGGGDSGESFCGNAVCETGEDEITCPTDCEGGGGGAICGNGICEVGEDEVTCFEDCGTASDSCDGIWNATGEDEGVECDAGLGCTDVCVCPSGSQPDGFGACVINPSFDSVTISTVWPTAVRYFDSLDLPKSSVQMAGYIGKYVNFSSAGETGCFQITLAEYISEYDTSYIRIENVAEIFAGDSYEVWDNSYCGNATALFS
jgi:hypothetical protein